jgi:predicted TIM-barrel fold metal-dependent hydrolase
MYNGSKVFDVHGHVSSPAAVWSHMHLLLASNTALPSPLASGARRGPELSDEAFRAAEQRHVTFMDERNIDVQIIGPRPFRMLGWMAPHLLPASTRFTNDCIAKQVQDFPDRFLGAAQLPQIAAADDISHCIPELERCVNELGFVAAYVSPDPEGKRNSPGMHEAYWYPLYEKAQAMNIPLIVHGTNCQDPRFGVVPHNYQLGFVIEQYLATQFLSHGDVFERYPELRVVVCHCGGALDRFIPTDPHLSQKDLSRNLFFDTCAHDLNFLTAAIKQRTVARTVFGTEAPGSGGAVRPETGRTADDLVPVISAMDFLSEEDKLAIFNRNPQRVFPQFARVGAAAAV